jgi:hypothetical protein
LSSLGTDEAAETGATSNVTRNTDTVIPSRELDAQNIDQFTLLINLAATLVHENVHVQQGSSIPKPGVNVALGR